MIEYNRMEEIRRDIHEHEIFLSFVDDEGAILFDDWWYTEGEKAFQEWAALEAGKVDE